MADIDDLVARSGELKQEVLDFACGRALRKELDKQLRSRFGDPMTVAEDGELESFFDWFIQQYRRPDGRTVVESFVDNRPELSECDRTFLRGWTDMVEGVFEVTGLDGPVLVAVNLVDDLEYRIRSNVGPSLFRRMPVGSFVIGRVVPVGEQWLLSGVCLPLRERDRDSAYRIATNLVLEHPELAYRNPRLLERSWEVQRVQRQAFVGYFGSDTVVLGVDEFPERMAAYFAVQNADGVAEQFVTDAVDRLPPSTRSIGLIYDEDDGLGIYADYDLLVAAFADPELVLDRRYRRIVRGYLDAEVSPVPLLRLAERDPVGASRLFAQCTKRSSFNWADDGERLLRKHKPSWYEAQRRPRIVTFGDRLAPHFAVC